MTTPSIRTDSPPKQGLLGEFHPANGVSLTLHSRGTEVLLLRHRVNTYASAADIAARVVCTGGAVSVVKWDEWHLEHQPVWMPSVEDWIRETIEAVS